MTLNEKALILIKEAERQKQDNLQILVFKASINFRDDSLLSKKELYRKQNSIKEFEDKVIANELDYIESLHYLSDEKKFFISNAYTPYVNFRGVYDASLSYEQLRVLVDGIREGVNVFAETGVSHLVPVEVLAERKDEKLFKLRIQQKYEKKRREGYV